MAPDSTFSIATSETGQRREHAVLDLLRVAELLDHRERDRLDALEHDREADDAGHEDRGERRLPRRAAATADALADLREHVEEDEARAGTAAGSCGG